ncbi:MAG: ABC transporter permease [Acidobacteriaceae bacterium]|nr:ABC transporter permease [Acidobacteriaceae bacterium]
MRDSQVGGLRKAGLLLAGAIAAVFFIQIANIASLMLARGVGRTREFDIRFSLGASRGRITRQVVTETVIVSLIGGAAGCLIAAALMRLLRSLVPATIPHGNQVGVDVRVLLFFGAATVVTGIIVGLIAALTLPDSRTLTVQAPSQDATKLPLYRRLIAFQIAISLMLITLAGMLIQSFEHLQSLAYGVRSEHVLLADISLGFKRYPNAASRQRFLYAMLDRLRALPGTTAAAFADTVPPSGFVHDRPFSNFVVDGVPVSVRGTGGMVVWRSITPQYFQALGIPLLRGRSFTDADRASRANMLVLSNSLARRLFGNNAAAIGQHLRTSPQSPDYTVIGVAADVRNNGLSPQQFPEYYELRKNIANAAQGSDADMMARSQHRYDGEGSVIVRTSGRPDLITQALRELDTTVPITESTFDSRIAELLQAPRFRTALVTTFAATALLLALSGIYGTMSYLISQRNREIGIRMAVGATRQQILSLMMKRALGWTASGLLAGLCLSFLAARWSQSLLFEVSARDSRVFVAAALLVLFAAITATLLPSLRATRIDPVQTIRQD